MAKKIRNTAALDMTTSSFGGSVELPSNQMTATDKYLAEKAAQTQAAVITLTEKEAAAPAPVTNGIEVTSVKVGEAKVTPAGHSAIKASLSEVQLKIMTVLYKLDAATPADEIHTLDSSVSVAQIKHHCYKDERLCRMGLVVCVKSEGTRTLSYRLTGAGMAVVRAR